MSRKQGAVLLCVQCIELVTVFIVWLSSHVHRSGVCLLQILLLLLRLLMHQGSRLTGSVETLHVPALSRHAPEIRLLTALFGQLLIQVGKEAHHSLIDLVINLLLNSWSNRCVRMVNLAIVEVINL